MKTSVPMARSRATAKKKESRPSDFTSEYVRRYPIGAELMPSGGVHFRVWAPKCERVEVQLSEGSELSSAGKLIEMDQEEQGYFSVHIPNAAAGMLYKFKLKEGLFPDPTSRFQPDGPHGPS